MSSYYEKILATGEVKCIDEEIPFEIPVGVGVVQIERCYLTRPNMEHQVKSLSYGDVPMFYEWVTFKMAKWLYDKLVC